MQTKNRISLTRKTLYAIMLLGIFFSTFGAGILPSARAQKAGTVTPPSSATATDQPYVPNVVILEVKPGISLTTDSKGDLGGLSVTNQSLLESTLASLGMSSAKPLFPSGQISQLSAQSENTVDLTTTYRVQLEPGTDVKSAVEVLGANPEVVFAEPDYIAYPADLPTLKHVPTSSQLSPALTVQPLTIDDPLYSQQWGMTKINIEGAWASTYGAPTVIIAVIDSGIDLTHIDLQNQLWTNPGEVAGNGIDDDNNGVIDDVDGWNFVYSNNDVWDDNGHGTLVAGVAAAIGGNGQGIVGVCPQCRIMPVKVMQASGAANYSDIAAGILYAAQKGAKVINLSLGGYANSNTLKNAIDTAVNTYGVAVVAGAGNDNLNTPFYPAAYDNVLAVAGTQTDDTKVDTSNYASWVDVSAPGINIRTTALGGGWVDNSGTSFAAPFASGLAGLLRTLHPDWSTNLTRAQIIHTTDNIDSVNPAYEGMLGNGRINAQTATLATATPLLNVSSYAIDGVTNGTPAPGSTVNLNVAIRNIWGTVTNTTGTLSTSDPYVTVTSASASYSDIDAYDAATNAIPFTFSVSSSAPYGHAMMFSLTINGTGGVNVVLPLEITTQSGTTSVSGMINSDTVWANDKTYLVVGNVLVSSGVTLTIQPGTVVKFNPDMSLLVGGTLIADGAQNQEVVFTSAQPSPAPGDWGIIKFTASSVDAVVDGAENYVSGSVFRYARIEYGKGVGLVDGLPYFSHVTFYKNSGNNEGVVTGCVDGASALHWVGKTPRTGSLVVRDSLFVENQFQGFATNQPGGGSVYFDVTSNQFLRNSGAAVVICNDFGGAQIVSNIIKDNGAGISLGNTGSGVIITDNFISGSKQPAYTAGFGVDIYSGSPIISHNIFANNGQGQTMCNGRCSVINIFSGGAPTVTSNTFVGNWLDSLIYFKWGGGGTYQNNNWAGNQVNYIFYRSTDSNQDVTATSNYWGTIDTTVIDGLIYDYLDDFNPGQVFYQPLLTAPDSSAPAFLWNATVTPDPVGIQQATFTLTFSKSMDPSADPIVTFGATSPYADYSVLDNGQWFDDHTWSATYDITSLVLRGTHTINVSGAKGTDGMEIPTDTRFSFVVDYAGSISDTTPPVQPTVTASGDGTLTTISASWSSSDAESPIIQYRYGIGTTPGARDVVAWNYVSSATTSMTRTGLNLTYGQPYYVTVGARNEGGLWSEGGVSNGVIDGVATTQTLSVSKTGTGSGTVTSSPEGINCGATCSASFNSNTAVTLTATATTGSTFTGWSGSCTGTDPCTVTMDAAKSVTANFSLDNTYRIYLPLVLR